MEDSSSIGGGDRVLSWLAGATLLSLGLLALILGAIFLATHAFPGAVLPAGLIGVVLVSIGIRLTRRAFYDDEPTDAELRRLIRNLLRRGDPMSATMIAGCLKIDLDQVQSALDQLVCLGQVRAAKYGEVRGQSWLVYYWQ
ncbi:MAG: hypothetical protein QME74_08995 [Candidatus Edwardsbacteria bacterium]|nr:hypothetical protein [Candidatus Edwardsbacteria bacterium]